MRTCFPSIAPMQLLKFHFSLNCFAISFHSSSVFGTCTYSHDSNIHLYICVISKQPLHLSGDLSGDEDGNPPIILGTSTKQPTKIGRKPTKRQKTEAVENDLIQKAIECMDKASQPTQSHADGFEIFGRYIASELWGILNPQAQRLAKLQIQAVLFNAQSESAVQVYLVPPFTPQSLPWKPNIHTSHNHTQHHTVL